MLFGQVSLNEGTVLSEKKSKRYFLTAIHDVMPIRVVPPNNAKHLRTKNKAYFTQKHGSLCLGTPTVLSYPLKVNQFLNSFLVSSKPNVFLVRRAKPFLQVYKKLTISSIVCPVWLIVLVYEIRIYLLLLSLNFRDIKTYLLDVFMGRELSFNLAAVVNYTFAFDHVTFKNHEKRLRKEDS